MNEVRETFEERPVFRCYLSSPRLSPYGDKMISFMCPHCQCEHTHGWRPEADPNRPTPRAAHCTKPSSPFFEHGYCVLFDPDAVRPERVKRQRRKYEFLERLAERDAEQDRAASRAASMNRPPKYTPVRRPVVA